MNIQQIITTFFRIANHFILNLEPVSLDSLPPPYPGRPYMLYLHVPFCESLCPYCSFNRVLFDEALARKYFTALRSEMRLVARQGYQFNALYVGGGTPTILLDELAKTIDLAVELFDVKMASCETNPDHLSTQLVNTLGPRIHRLSVGIQSFDNKLLKKINRYERFGSGQEIFERIQAFAHFFPTFNVDLIFNFPGQTKEILLQDIQKVIQSGANQVTFYPLMVSPSVRSTLELAVGIVDLDREKIYYDQIIEAMSQEFHQDSAWCFSRKGKACIDEYIVDYDEFVGLGTSAFSYLNHTLYVNTFSQDIYERSVHAGKSPISAIRRFGEHSAMCYRLMMDLFGLQLDKKRYRQTFGKSLERSLPIELALLKLFGAIDHDDPDTIVLSPRGRYLEVVMMREFFSGVNRFRDQERQRLTQSIVRTCTPNTDADQCAVQLKSESTSR